METGSGKGRFANEFYEVRTIRFMQETMLNTKAATKETMSSGASKQPESKTNNWGNLPIVFMCHGLDYVSSSFSLSLNKHLLSIQHAHTVFCS